MNILLIILLVIMTFIAGFGIGIIAPVLITMQRKSRPKKRSIAPEAVKQTEEEARRHLRAQKELENLYAYDGTEQEDIVV